MMGENRKFLIIFKNGTVVETPNPGSEYSIDELKHFFPKSERPEHAHYSY